MPQPRGMLAAGWRMVGAPTTRSRSLGDQALLIVTYLEHLADRVDLDDGFPGT